MCRNRRTREWVRAGLRGGALLCGACLLLVGCGRDVSPREKRLEELLRQCDMHTSEERLAAIRELGWTRDPRAVQPLIRLLYEARADVRQAAAEALGQIGDRSAVEHIVKMLAPSQGWSERKAAACALGEIGDPSAVGPLLGALRDQEATVSFAAAFALGSIGSPALGPVLDVYMGPQPKNPTNDLRKVCVESIRVMRDRAAARELRALLANPVPELRLAAAHALCGMRELSAAGEVVRLLDDPAEDVLQGVQGALARWGEAVAGPLGDGLASGLRSPRGRLAAVGALAEIASPAALNLLLAAAAMEDEGAAAAAREALRKLADDAKVARLLRDAIRGADSRLAVGALLAAGVSGDEDTLGAVRAALDSADSKVRRAAVDFLGRMGSAAPLDLLAAVLADPDELARVKAARFLASRDDRRGLDAAGTAVRAAAARLRDGSVSADGAGVDAESAVLLPAVDTVARLRDKAAAEPLTVLLKHPDRRIAGLAVDGLGRLGAGSAVSELAGLLGSEDPDIVRRVVAALGAIGDPRAVPSLLPLLESGDQRLVDLVAESLGRIGDPRALDPLASLLKSKDEGVRDRGIVALGHLRDPRAIELLVPLLRPLYDRIAAEVAWAEEDIRLKPQMDAYRKAMAEWEDKYGDIVSEREKAARQDASAGKDRAQKADAPRLEVPPRPQRPATKDRRDRRGRFQTEMLVIEALGNIGGPEAFDLIARVLKGRVIGDLHQIDAHTCVVFDALVNTRDPRAFQEILAAYKQIFADDYFAATRRYALQALARADADAAVPVLAEALDTTAPTSYGALAGLLKTAGEIGDERVFPALVKWMSHDSMSVRVEARDAFAAIGSRSPSLPIEYMADAPAGARSYVSLVFPQIGPKAVPHLCEALLTHRAPQARQGAAWALGHMRLAEGVPALLRALAEEKHPKVRGGAVWALGEIADPRAVAPLTPLLKDEDPETRTAAAVSLGQLADVGARDALIEALKDGVAQVRAAAALALGSIGDEGARAALIAVQKDRNGEVAGNAGRALRMLDGKKERAGDAN